MEEAIEKFLAEKFFAVVGASKDRQKYGNKVLLCYLHHGMQVYGVNPSEKSIEGVQCFASVTDLPNMVLSVSIVTPPSITEKVVDECIQKGIKNLWMQPGAESEKAIAKAESHGLNVIAGGPCILVTLGC